MSKPQAREEEKAKLKARLNQIRDEEREEEKARFAKRRELLLLYIDGLIELGPSHSHDMPSNLEEAGPWRHSDRCSRCALLEARGSRLWSDEFDVTISVIHRNPDGD